LSRAAPGSPRYYKILPKIRDPPGKFFPTCSSPPPPCIFNHVHLCLLVTNSYFRKIVMSWRMWTYLHRRVIGKRPSLLFSFSKLAVNLFIHLWDSICKSNHTVCHRKENLLFFCFLTYNFEANNRMGFSI
jgi:hypothetical protein